MILCNKLIKLLNNEKKWTVLDLWAWTWNYSIFCASYGYKVVALDNESKQEWLWPEYLKDHPNIQFINWDLRELPEEVTSKKYPIILLFNVVPFLFEKFFQKLLLPQIIDMLDDGWVLAMSFFFPDDDMMKNSQLTSYTFESFENSEIFKIVNKDDFYFEETHAPMWKHTHHIGYMELMKK